MKQKPIKIKIMKKIYMLIMLAFLSFGWNDAQACHNSYFSLISMVDLGGNQYEFTVEFCVGGGRDAAGYGAVSYTGTWAVLLDNGSSFSSFPATLTSPATGSVFTGYDNLYGPGLLVYDNELYDWLDAWACIEFECGAQAQHCITFTFTTTGLPNSIELMGAEGGGVGVVPYGCNGDPDLTIDLASPSVDAGADVEVIYGFGSNCTTLSAAATDGVAPYSYLWSNGSTAVSTSVCPTSTTTYTVTVTDFNGNTATDDVVVEVNDITCGNDKVYVCHRGRTRCVRINQVQGHLDHGDQLGGCRSRLAFQDVEGEYGISAYPNPTNGELELEVMVDLDDVASIDLYGIDGRLIVNLASNMELFMDEMEHIHVDLSKFENGFYFISMRTESGELVTEKIQIMK